jgi:phosphotriesterase-related protein
MHEHLQCDATVWYRNRSPEDERFQSVDVGPETIANVRWHAYSFQDNLRLDDDGAAVDGLQRFAAAGGRTVVDTTTIGLSPRPDVVASIARRAHVNVVHGAGFYVHPSHTPDVCTANVDALAARLDREVTAGVAGSGVLPGILGEIGMSAPPEPCERNVLRAAARVADRWRMSVVIHVDGGGRFGTEHVEDCMSEGLPADRVICGHMDERLDAAYHRDIVKMGATVAFDTFGSELKFSGLFDHPSDTERMRYLADLLDGGWEQQIVLAHDVFVKAHLHGFGGNGYEHLPARVLPTLQAGYGISAAVLDQLMVHNPRRHLTCQPPARPDVRAGRRTRATPTGRERSRR